MNSTLTNTGPLLRFTMRLDRIKGSIWLFGTIIFVPYVLLAYETVFADVEQLQSILSMLGNPAMALFTGPGYGLDASTVDNPAAIQLVFAGVYWGYLLILVALMNMFLVTRHTRAEEQAGRAELLRADVLGSNAPLTATMIWALLNNLILGIAITASFVAFGSVFSSSLLVGAATCFFGLFMAALTAVFAQLTAFSSATSGFTGAFLGVAYILRGLGDMTAPAGEHGTWLSWLSPLAWVQQTRVFYDDRWWPALLCLVAAVVLVALAYLLQSRRDVGSGLWAARSGRQSASAWLANMPMAIFAIQRSRITWWTIGLVLAAIMYGSFTQAMVDAFATLPDLFKQLMGGASGALVGYVTLSITMYQVMLAVFAVMMVGNLASEERAGRLEPLLATKTSPARWLGWNWFWTALTATVISVLIGGLAGVFAYAVDNEGKWIQEGILGGLVGVPAVLIVLGLAFALYAWAPRWLSLAWVPVIYGGITQLFGEMLNLPEWAMSLSPFHATPQYPADSIEALPLVIQTAIGLGLFAVAVFGIKRRNIPTA